MAALVADDYGSDRFGPKNQSSRIVLHVARGGLVDVVLYACLASLHE
jgi:hypothetical protein